LSDLGVDLTYLQWIINLRNEYVHSCSLYIGYTVGYDDDTEKIYLEAREPTLSFPLAPIVAVRSERIQYYSDQMIDLIGSFIDHTEWWLVWSKITKKLEGLPKNPDPEYAQIANESKDESENEHEILDTLNQKFIGDGAKLLLMH